MEKRASDGGLRVLVAEDTESILTLLELCLTKAGHRIETAQDGDKALAKFLPGAFDVVILDMRMPVLDGYGAAREIRAREKAASCARPVPIIALTANLQPDEISRSREAGCTSFLGKPFTKMDLLDVIAQAAQDAPAPFAAASSAHPDPELADLVPRFLEHRRREVPVVTEALGRGDYKAVEEFGHKMAGAGGSYGFPEMSALGKRIELAAKARDGAAALLGLKELVDHLKTLVVAP